LKKIIKINQTNIEECINLILKNLTEFEIFKKMGWSADQYRNQASKEKNFSLSLLESNKLIGFILGDLHIYNEFNEYEILLIYVDIHHRNKGNASLLINSILDLDIENKLSKISLEVAENNLSAIKLYEKNKFIKIGLRKNYFFAVSGIKENAILYERKIDG